MGIVHNVWPSGYVIQAWLLSPLQGKKGCVVAAEVKGPLCSSSGILGISPPSASSRNHNSGALISATPAQPPPALQEHPSPGIFACTAVRP